MRAVGKIVAGTAGILFALPAAAAITHDQAFELCIEQPALQVDNLQSIVEEQLSRPHPSVWNSMTMPQIVNASQYYQGNICADQLMDHQDAFAVIVMQKFLSKTGWGVAWVALNSYCKDHLSGKCIQAEVDAITAIRESNNKGISPSNRVCDAMLDWSASDPVQVKQCMDIVGDQHPEERIVQDCLRSMGWHSQADGKAAGRAVQQCFADKAKQ